MRHLKGLLFIVCPGCVPATSPAGVIICRAGSWATERSGSGGGDRTPRPELGRRCCPAQAQRMKGVDRRMPDRMGCRAANGALSGTLPSLSSAGRSGWRRGLRSVPFGLPARSRRGAGAVERGGLEMRLAPSRPISFCTGRVLFQSLSGRCDPLSWRFVSSRSGAFGSKIGSRANPRLFGAMGKGRGPPFKAVSSPIGRAVRF